MGESKDKRELSPAEWNVMESLWNGAPKIGSQIVADLKESVGWSRSTTLTMLRRMSEKGLVVSRDIRRLKAFFPLVDREMAVRKESEHFLDRVYHGDTVQLVKTFLENRALSKDEIAELYHVLEKAEEKLK